MNISPEFVKKYSISINGRPNPNLMGLSLNDMEKAFCSYCSAVGKLVNAIYYYDFKNKNASYEQLQKMVETANRILEEFAAPYLPSKDAKNPRLTFNKEEFLKANKGSSFAPLVADFMAGVVYAETLQKGYKLENDFAYNNNSLDCDLVYHYTYVAPEYLANDIDVKIRKSEMVR